jgi:succinyl-diaminopimelate desuccinylase
MLSTTLPRESMALVQRAREHLNPDDVADLLEQMVAIPSPTGQELAVAELVVGHLQEKGVRAEVQAIEGELANAVARHGRAEKESPRLLLYAPLDTAFSGDPAEDRPWLGTQPRADFALPPQRDGTLVTGLGAENPKGFAAAAIFAVEALAQAEVDFPGDLVVGLVGGSMPVIDRPAAGLSQIGFGQGVRFLLESGLRPDMAIVLKPGYAASYEEVGVAWFRVITHGQVNYTGIRHKTTYRNPILFAGKLMAALEAWFPEYARENGDEAVLPQASINAIHAGSVDRLGFVPSTCELDVDVRVPPSLSPTEVAGELRLALDRIARDDPDLETEMERLSALPGSRTDPDHWVVQTLVRAWEWKERREHAFAKNGSGASDAALLRGAGIPTARIGLPPSETPFDGFSMGSVDTMAVVRLAEVLIHAIVDTCTRTRADVGVA